MQAGGSVILTGSTSSLVANLAFSVYSATKAAVCSFARTWILDLKGTGIRVNVLSSGPTKMPGLVGLVTPDQEQALLESFAAKLPIGRVADPDEIGKAAVFLASDDSSFVTGIELFVDGARRRFEGSDSVLFDEALSSRGIVQRKLDHDRASPPRRPRRRAGLA
jgi:NAD(P)-dependent dehydrogenase (short-subunit alcohol dehydrogenase family)